MFVYCILSILLAQYTHEFLFYINKSDVRGQKKNKKHVDAVWQIYLSRKSFAFVGNFSNSCKSHYNCVHFEVMVYIERDSLQLMQTCKNFIQ